jgi:hypothetical protein
VAHQQKSTTVFTVMLFLLIVPLASARGVISHTSYFLLPAYLIS